MSQRLIFVRAAVIYHRNSIEIWTGSDPRA
jgi:hypothetical protein